MNKITVQSNIDSFLRKLYNTVEEATEHVGKMLLEESKPQVPVDTGELKDSGYTKMIKEGLEFRVEIGYTAPYAVRVHENYNCNHPNGGNAGYLIKPFRVNEKDYVDYIGSQIKKIT